MELKEIMSFRKFAVVGDTLNPEKTAYQIKEKMIHAGYEVYAVGKELASINDIQDDIDVIDLCVHPVKGLNLLKENKKTVKCVVIQPGAENDELIDWLKENDIAYINGCLMVGLSLYGRK